MVRVCQKFLHFFQNVLQRSCEDVGPMARLQFRWHVSRLRIESFAHAEANIKPPDANCKLLSYGPVLRDDVAIKARLLSLGVRLFQMFNAERKRLLSHAIMRAGYRHVLDRFFGFEVTHPVAGSYFRRWERSLFEVVANDRLGVGKFGKVHHEGPDRSEFSQVRVTKDRIDFI